MMVHELIAVLRAATVAERAEIRAILGIGDDYANTMGLDDFKVMLARRGEESTRAKGKAKEQED